MASVDITRIASNISGMNALNSLQNVNSRLAVHQERLSSGRRINTAADDVAGLTVASKVEVRREELKTSLNAIRESKNISSAAEGGLSNMQDVLTKMRDKAIEAGSSDISATQRDDANDQLKTLRNELDTIATNTQWNGKNLLTGADGKGRSEAITISLGGLNTDNGAMGFSFQSNQGFNASSGTNDGNSISAEGLGLSDAALEIKMTTTTDTQGVSSTTNNFKDVVSKIDAALSAVKSGKDQVSGFNARLTFREESLTVQAANTEASYSRIMNAGMADEQVLASKSMILQQTSTAMLAQANQAPQQVMSLLR